LSGSGAAGASCADAGAGASGGASGGALSAVVGHPFAFVGIRSLD